MHVREPRDFQSIHAERQSRLRWRKARRWMVASLCALVAIVVLGYVLYIRPYPALAAKTITPNVAVNQVAMQWPTVGQAAIGIEGQGPMAATANQKPVPMASVAKVMTALAVLKKYPLQAGQAGPVLTMTQADVDRYNNYVSQDGSAVVVHVGQQLTERQMLQAVLLPSANNIADSLAIWAYGSMGQYHVAANQLAQTLGMTQTTFAGDASGFLPESVSTARDLVVLGQAAMADPAIKEIVAQPSADFPVVGTIRNVNVMLGTGGIVGIKTGNTDQAGGCFLFAATRQIASGQSVTVVGAILGAPALGNALAGSVPLLDSFYNGFTSSVVVPKGTVVARYTVPWTNQMVTATTAQDTSLYNWAGIKPSVKVEVNKVSVPQNAGSQVGSLTAQSPYAKTTTPVVLTTTVSQPNWQWRVYKR